MRRLAIGLIAATALTRGAAGQVPAAWDSVARILQTAPTPSPGYVRYNFPRTDLTLRIGDVTVARALALGTWAGFGGDPSDADMMGDLVLTADEVGPVQAELMRQGIMVTAVHNHLVGEEPRITYLHYHARGVATVLAARLDHVLARTGVPRPVVAAAAAPLTIDTGMVFGTLGVRGRAAGNVAQVGLVLVPGAVTMDGRVLVPALAYGTPINVQMVSATRAVATGDYSVPAEKVQAVVLALTSRGIIVTAVHSHLVGESPKVSYIHFWADGPSADVLAGLRGAIDAAR